MPRASVNQPELPCPPALLSPRELAAILRVDARTLRRLVSSGEVPQADIVLTAKIKRWRRETIERWIEARSRDGQRVRMVGAA